MVDDPAAPSPQSATPATAAPPAPTLTDRTGRATPSGRVNPGSPEWYALAPEQRHQQLRGPENPRARGPSPARDQREDAAARAAGELPAVAVDPNNQPAHSSEKLKVGKFEVSEEELASMMDRQAQDDLRKATVPPTPEAYKLEISPGAKLPGNVEFRFDGNDPALIAAKAWAHSKGLDQSAFSEMLTLYASHVAQQETALTERSRAEIAKAGQFARRGRLLAATPRRARYQRHPGLRQDEFRTTAPGTGSTCGTAPIT